MPWDSVTKDLFLGIFGCTFHVADGVGGIHFPDTSLDTKHGRRNRARLLRCWLEIGLVIEDLRKRFRQSFPSSPPIRSRLTFNSQHTKSVWELRCSRRAPLE